MDSTVLFMIGFAIVLIIVGIITAKRRNKLLEEGIIIKRNYSYESMKHTFINRVPFMEFYEQFTTYSVEKHGISYEGNKSGILTFTCSSGWQANLNAKPLGDREHYQYDFCFTKWKTHNGMALGYLEMNMLLTAIEKALLDLDEETEITRQNLETKTKSKFF